MIGVTITRKVSLDLTAEQWQLYSSKPRVKTVARSMNREIETICNATISASEARWAAEKVLDKYREYGTADTEPCGVLRDILARVYLS